ncbi:MAG: hypothetical protein WBD63_00370 [Phycisphaerae bacterium]|nr:hypothetical protein [Phycisphaerae bacterium]
MSPRRSEELVDGPYRLVVLDLPRLLAEAPVEERAAICERLEALLDRQVRVLLVAPAEVEAMDRDVCRGIRGLSKVFLFVWTAGAELFGFDQHGQAVQLAAGRKDDPNALALYAVDAVAEPADIPLEEILVVGESLNAGHALSAFASGAYDGVRLVALADRQKVPAGVRRAVPSHRTVAELLDSLLFEMA